MNADTLRLFARCRAAAQAACASGAPAAVCRDERPAGLTPREAEQLSAFRPAALAVIARALGRLGDGPPAVSRGRGGGVRQAGGTRAKS